MAGHSKFANIKHRKGAQDEKRAKVFTKIAREIIAAVKVSGGQTDPSSNPRLRGAIASARAVNMPNDRINTAIKRGEGNNDADNYEEIRYEGYAGGGVAIIVEVLTDNRNRSASEIRTIFNKHGGALGESGSVAFMFDRVGYIVYPADKASADEMFEAALEAGADDVESGEEAHEIYCDAESFNEVREALAEKFGDADTGRLSWKPQNYIEVDAEKAEKLMNFVDALEDNDDVQYVVANFDVPDDVAAKMAAG